MSLSGDYRRSSYEFQEHALCFVYLHCFQSYHHISVSSIFMLFFGVLWGNKKNPPSFVRMTGYVVRYIATQPVFFVPVCPTNFPHCRFLSVDTDDAGSIKQTQCQRAVCSKMQIMFKHGERILTQLHALSRTFLRFFCLIASYSESMSYRIII